MGNKLLQTTGSSQLRWVILLLAIAVILPTVCLLWFMNQAVKNERLAVKQKLIDSYTNRAEKFFVEYPDMYWKGNRQRLESRERALNNRIWLFAEVFADDRFPGFVIYDSNGAIIWPIKDSPKIPDPDTENLFQRAFELEFEQNNIAEALDEYREISSESNEPAVTFLADMTAVRCLDKSGKTEQAVELCYKLAYPGIEDRSNCPLAAKILQARVRLAELYSKTGDKELFFHLRRTLGNSRYNDEKEQPATAFPSQPRVWALQKLISIADGTDLSARLEREIKNAQKTIEIEQISFTVSEILADAAALKDWPEETIRRLDLPGSVHAVHYKIADKIILCLMRQEYFASFLHAALDDMNDDTVTCRILDNLGNFAAGLQNPGGRPFVTLAGMGRFMPEWSAELYFTDAEVFENAGKRQAAIYTWTAVLVILLIVAAGAVAGQTVGRQIKLNRLKNDFIATITHELKTPLSSMRVLVDTLLEGNYSDQQQATEYLQLISKENLRLSRLIDNFLTFSRMERNKQAFDIAPARPAEIAADAVEAVRAKFSKPNCRFDVEIDQPLPDILADHDAMVTVLVNLLDNAYKYTNDEKRIKLKVFTEDNSVCFSVSDNGIGMPHRAVKRIFNRFYQVDRSLSRSAEGCGLGLSIVKFIIDAHNGRITVESRAGQGSTFVVKLNRIS